MHLNGQLGMVNHHWILKMGSEEGPYPNTGAYSSSTRMHLDIVFKDTTTVEGSLSLH